METIRRSPRRISLLILVAVGMIIALCCYPQSPKDRRYAAPGDGTTRITIDGDPSDWARYPAIEEDPAGDSTGNVDVTYVYAFTNDTYLYVLVEVEVAGAGGIGSYAVLGLDLRVKDPHGQPPEFAVRAEPYKNPHPWIGREEENGQTVSLGEHGEAAQGKAFEIRIPLKLFGEPAPKTVEVLVFDGVCCGPEWRVVDYAPPATILRTEETEPPLASLADLMAATSAFCHATGSTSAGFQPATAVRVPTGYKAEYFVPPSGLNMPSDVVVKPNGDIVVVSGGSYELYQITPDGRMSLLLKGFTPWSLDRDAAGNLYGHDGGSGRVYRVSPEGGIAVIAQLAQTCAEPTLAAAPDGTLYIGYRPCGAMSGGKDVIYVIHPGGKDAERLVGDLESVQALDVRCDGTLYGVLGRSLTIIDTKTGAMQRLAEIPEWGSYHGLAVADDGTAYASSGGFGTSGHLYRIMPDGKVNTVASFENSGLRGLAIAPSGEIIAAQTCLSGVLAISPAGAVRNLVRPNGLVTPLALAVSPCGEMAVVMREAGFLALVTPDGSVRSFTRVLTFTPPQTYLAFSQVGWYVVGESAPGFPSLVNRYLPNGASEALAVELRYASGVAVGSDDVVYASGVLDGKVVRIMPDGARQVVAADLQTPQALALSPDGILYVITGGEAAGGVFEIPTWGDTVTSVDAGGRVATLAKVDHAAALAIGPDGVVYVAAGKRVCRLPPAGALEVFATGFGSASGLAFDVAGNLCVADEVVNAIVRIRGFPQSRLSGVVADAETGVPLAGVRVRVVQAVPPFAGGMVPSGSDGSFSIPVAPGVYDVVAWADGYKASELSMVTVRDLVLSITVFLHR